MGEGEKVTDGRKNVGTGKVILVICELFARFFTNYPVRAVGLSPSVGLSSSVELTDYGPVGADRHRPHYADTVYLQGEQHHQTCGADQSLDWCSGAVHHGEVVHHSMVHHSMVHHVVGTAPGH